MHRRKPPSRDKSSDNGSYPPSILEQLRRPQIPEQAHDGQRGPSRYFCRTRELGTLAHERDDKTLHRRKSFSNHFAFMVSCGVSKLWSGTLIAYIGPKQVFSKVSEALLGKRLSSSATAANSLEQPQLSSDGRNTWLLHCVTPPNKLSANAMSASERGRHSKDHLNASVSQQEFFSKNQTFPVVLKRGTC